MEYGYVRVSSSYQNVDRQLEEMLKRNINKKNIFVDYESGKDFNRINYQKLKKKLKENDLLVVKSIDRLGRNYEMIISEWKSIIKDIKANICVIDMPLLDTRVSEKNLVGNFICDIVLQLLSFVAETERDNIKKRQAEGIRLAKLKGKHLGRPKYILPQNFFNVTCEYKNKKISLKTALEKLSMKKSTFYKFLNKI